jgi:hypothetical protein
VGALVSNISLSFPLFQRTVSGHWVNGNVVNGYGNSTAGGVTTTNSSPNGANGTMTHTNGVVANGGGSDGQGGQNWQIVIFSTLYMNYREGFYKGNAAMERGAVYS